MKIIQKITFLSLLFATVLNGMDKEPKKSSSGHNPSPSSYVSEMEQALEKIDDDNFEPIAVMIASNLAQGLNNMPEEYFAASNTKIIINALTKPVLSKEISQELNTKIIDFVNSLDLNKMNTNPIKSTFLPLLKKTISTQTTFLIPGTKDNIEWLPFYICNTVKPHLKRELIRYEKIMGWYENPSSESRRKKVQRIYNEYLENPDTLKLLNVLSEKILHKPSKSSPNKSKILDQIKEIVSKHSKKRVVLFTNFPIFRIKSLKNQCI